MGCLILRVLLRTKQKMHVSFKELAHVFIFASAKIKIISEKKEELKLNYHNR